ncbi:hypothetical protein ACC754_34230 [Rhizobium johnstonii]|uniref:hypothetical protein n=1 Tax=Rhizobium johnstonii TaxID=3019933 RepID=UPI003F94DF29
MQASTLSILPFRTHEAERPDRHAECASTMFGEVQHAVMGKTIAKDVAEEGGISTAPAVSPLAIREQLSRPQADLLAKGPGGPFRIGRWWYRQASGW